MPQPKSTVFLLFSVTGACSYGIFEISYHIHKYIDTYIHIYTHNWPLQPFSQDYRLSSYTAHVVWVNFICVWRYLQFNIDSVRQIFFRNFFMAGLFTLRVFVRNLLRGNHRITFWCLTWDMNAGFTSNKTIHYLLQHGDFIHTHIYIFQL